MRNIKPFMLIALLLAMLSFSACTGTTEVEAKESAVTERPADDSVHNTDDKIRTLTITGRVCNAF